LCKNKKIAVFFKTQILKKIKRKQKKYVVLPPPSTIISSLSLSLSLSLSQHKPSMASTNFTSKPKETMFHWASLVAQKN
jgi:hypothetical protein